MKKRRTNVAWDPTLIRVEHLDANGAPYFCEFEKQDGPGGKAAPDETTRVQGPLRRLSVGLGVVTLLILLAAMVWAVF
jgi:hypothetical protein